MILCHVSSTFTLDELIPASCDSNPPCVYFSRGEFASFYGDYVYLFSEKVLKEKYRLIYRGETRHSRATTTGDEMTIHTEINGFHEFVCPVPVRVEDAIGVIKHRDMNKDNFLGRKQPIIPNFNKNNG